MSITPFALEGCRSFSTGIHERVELVEAVDDGIVRSGRTRAEKHRHELEEARERCRRFDHDHDHDRW